MSLACVGSLTLIVCRRPVSCEWRVVSVTTIFTAEMGFVFTSSPVVTYFSQADFNPLRKDTNETIKDIIDRYKQSFLAFQSDLLVKFKLVLFLVRLSC